MYSGEVSAAEEIAEFLEVSVEAVRAYVRRLKLTAPSDQVSCGIDEEPARHSANEARPATFFLSKETEPQLATLDRRPRKGDAGAEENRLYEAWKTASEADRPRVEQRLYQSVLEHAKKIVWLRLQESSPELARDIATAVMTQLAGFRGDAKFGTWVEKIARIKVAGEIRNREKERPRHAVDPDELPDNRAVDSINRDLLWASLERGLNTEESTILRNLREGTPIRIIAEMLDKSEAATESQCRRLKKELQNKFAGCDGKACPGATN